MTNDGSRFAPPFRCFKLKMIAFLKFLRVNIYYNVFQIRVDVQGFRSGLPGAVAGLLQPAEWHMGFAAEGSGIDDCYASLDFPAKLHGPMEVESMNTGGKAIG